MAITRTVTVLDAADIETESSFWAEVLGGTVEKDDDWHSISVAGESRFAIQLAPEHVKPTWPDPATQQQLHLDLWFDELAPEHERIIRLGAQMVQASPDLAAADGFQVYLDPAGHPFCLCWHRSTP